VDAFPGDVFGGVVTAIDPSIDAGSRSAKLRAQIENPDGRLRPGQFAQLQLDTSVDGNAGANALLIPEQALMQDGEQRFVYTVVAGKAKKVVVRTGARVPGKVQVIDGLKAGDVVITAGQAKPMMHEGAAVMVLPESGLPPEGAAQPGATAAMATRPQSARAPVAGEKPAAEKSEQSN
ncbi:MAG: efflux RND transporter periplasmic adaptor subunit, partial [Gammaproteobacteria bacterium]|nr:efflux RND transporter periplasmic adaptor subunit [Gammaproteobacteria bacterium]